MSAVIRLSDGSIALVDDEDFVLLAQYSWNTLRTNGRVYATTRSPDVDGDRTCRYMHRVILDAPADIQVDHLNGDGLDNRRENLRLATNSQNSKNKGRYRNNSSGYKGVYKRLGRERWRADIMSDGQRRRLGEFSSAEEAARAYDKAALELHGEFARLNFQVEEQHV